MFWFPNYALSQESNMGAGDERILMDRIHKKMDW
jgi:hypothetical protein